MLLNDKKILLTGGAGFLGKAVLKKLRDRGIPKKQITIPRTATCDLRVRENCYKAAKGQDVVIHLAATVGGIGFNKRNPAILFYNNAVMSLHLIDAAYHNGVKKFVGLGSVCSYPEHTAAPFKEDDVWNGYPAVTTAPYGLAKKMMLVQSQAYRSQYNFDAIHLLMINLYGPGDNIDIEDSHVIAALIRKVAEAKRDGKDTLEVWGTGKATREFLYVEDAAEAIVLAAECYDKPEPINIGSGTEIAIKDLAELICRLMDFRETIVWNSSRPDGQLRRRLDVSKAEKEFGFKARWSLEEGLRKTIEWFLREVK